MKQETLKKTRITGYIIITICIIALIVQTIKPNEIIKLMGMLLAVSYVVGCELIKLPLYQYNEKNEKKVKKYMMMAIIPDIPLYILMIVVFNIGYSGGTYLDRTEYGILIMLLNLFIYSIQYIIILLPCLILHCIGFFKLLKVKKEK